MPRAGAKRPSKAKSQPTRWLDKDEEAAWRALATILVKLPWALECQLQRDSGLSFIEYHALAKASLSGLSHRMTRVESRGLVRREADPEDGRFTNAILTKAGYAKLVASAPAHVATVRDLVIDAVSAAELQQLRETMGRLHARIEAANPP